MSGEDPTARLLPVGVLVARPADAERLAGIVTAADAVRAERWHQAADRARSSVAAALLRIAAASMLGTVAAAVDLGRWCPRCGPADHGRPVVLAPDGRPVPAVHLSASHAGDLVVAAATRAGLIGIDVERVGAATFDGFARTVLASRERRVLSAVPAADQARWCARLWTRKEALLKALGLGLAVDPGQVDVLGPARWPPGLADGTWGSSTDDLQAHLIDLPASVGTDEQVGRPGSAGDSDGPGDDHVGTVAMLTTDERLPTVTAVRLPSGPVDPAWVPDLGGAPTGHQQVGGMEAQVAVADSGRATRSWAEQDGR